MLNVAPAQMNVDVILVLGEIYFNVQMKPLQRPLLIYRGLCFWLSDFSTSFLIVGNWFTPWNHPKLLSLHFLLPRQWCGLTIIIIKMLCSRGKKRHFRAVVPFPDHPEFISKATGRKKMPYQGLTHLTPGNSRATQDKRFLTLGPSESWTNLFFYCLPLRWEIHQLRSTSDINILYLNWGQNKWVGKRRGIHDNMWGLVLPSKCFQGNMKGRKPQTTSG